MKAVASVLSHGRRSTRTATSRTSAEREYMRLHSQNMIAPRVLKNLQNKLKLHIESEEADWPEFLCCPILLSPFKHPVVLQGNTFEGSAIRRHLQRRSCNPLTNVYATSKMLSPNYLLQEEVNRRRSSHAARRRDMEAGIETAQERVRSTKEARDAHGQRHNVSLRDLKKSFSAPARLAAAPQPVGFFGILKRSRAGV